MNMKEAIAKATKLEGGKRNLSIADMTEAVGCFLEVLAEESKVYGSSFLNRCQMLGESRAKKRAKKKRYH